MRVLISLSYYYPNISGLTVYAKNLAEEFVKRGHWVTILTSQHEKSLPKKQRMQGISVQRVPYLFKVSKGFLMPYYPWHALTLVQKHEVIIINLPQLEGFVVALLAKLLGKRVYCIYHCDVVLPKNLVAWFVESVLHISNSASLFLANTIITNSKDFASHSKLLSFFSKKIIYVYPPMLPPLVDRAVRKNLQKRIPRDKKYTIGFVGRIASDKGVEFLLEAVPIMREKMEEEFIILFAGPRRPVGEDEYWKRMRSLCKKYKEDTMFLGTLSPEELGAFYSLLDVLVLPSINSTEAFGMVQVEAMLCGVPVVASNLPGVRVPIRATGMGELVRIRDSRDLAEKIARILKNKKEYVRKRALVKKTFSFQSTIMQYEKLLSGFDNIPVGKKFEERQIA